MDKITITKDEFMSTTVRASKFGPIKEIIDEDPAFLLYNAMFSASIATMLFDADEIKKEKPECFKPKFKDIYDIAIGSKHYYIMEDMAEHNYRVLVYNSGSFSHNSKSFKTVDKAYQCILEELAGN